MGMSTRPFPSGQGIFPSGQWELLKFQAQLARTPESMLPPVMPSPISCTTPDEPGLMYSTRRGLEELACATANASVNYRWYVPHTP